MLKNKRKSRKIRNIAIISIAIIILIFVCIKINIVDIITSGINSNLKENLASKPSEIFDKDGTDPNKLHIGDFVNYDAGTWTQEEINEIKTGLKSNPVTANGTKTLPTKGYQFGGFTAGSSRNGSAVPSTWDSVTYDYIKDKETNQEVTGWRVFDIEDDGTITLISAGNPEAVYFDWNKGFQCEYVLTGNKNSQWTTQGETADEMLTRKNWNVYVNAAQYAQKAEPLTLSRLDRWYSKYIEKTETIYDNDPVFQKIYQSQYYKYQNLIDNYSMYWLADAKDQFANTVLWTSEKTISTNCDDAYGIRMLVTLQPEILLEKKGNKTLTGGNMTTNGGDQTYNVWGIKTPPPVKPSEIFDKEGTDPNKLHIGDFVNYDAGTWTQEEINAIKTGKIGSLSTANGTATKPTGDYQFGGFVAGGSKNSSAINSGYSGENYAQDASNGGDLTGWRVFDIQGDQITLISAGNPENFSEPILFAGYQSQYILSGSINSAWSNGEADSKNYQKRNWNNYINSNQRAVSAKALTLQDLNKWYGKYIVPNADVLDPAVYLQIEQSKYKKYHNLIESGVAYFLCETNHENGMFENTDTDWGIGWIEVGTSRGIRVLVTLSSDILLSKNGTKAVSYEGVQTYNVWNLITDQTPPNAGTISANTYYTNQPNVTAYVTGASDAETGISHVDINGWHGAGWVAEHKTIKGTYDSANDRYYATHKFAEMPDTTTGEVNQGDGKYTIDAHIYDNAGNSDISDRITIIYDTTEPTISVNTPISEWRNSPLSLTITVDDPLKNGSNSGLAEDNTYQYYLSTSETELTGGSWQNYTSGTPFEINPQKDGTYYLFVKRIKDKAGNISTKNGTETTIGSETYLKIGTYQFDKTEPTLSINTKSCTWRNIPLDLTITANDPISNGVSSGPLENELFQYYLSNSPTELTGGSWQSYANGTPFEINPRISGTYYLFAKRITDKAGNIATTEGTATTIGSETYQMMGTYEFDYDKPTVGTLTMKLGTIDGKDYVSNTFTTEKVYVYANDGSDELSGHGSTTYSINGGIAKPSGKENATVLSEKGLYYIVVTTTDKIGNTAKSEEYIVNINSISPDQQLGITNGTINPIYKPEWTKIESSTDIENKKLTVTIKGSAYNSQNVDENVDINYSSDVTSTLEAEDITVFIDGKEVTSKTNPNIVVDAGTVSINGTSGKTEITHKIELSNMEEALRQVGIPYKEWSGNVSLKIGGRGKDPSTYSNDVLTDIYGNQNMMETDQNGTNADGTWIDVKYEDAKIEQNTDGVMFADFVKPEFSYIYSEADIDYTGKTVKVIFSVTDKYFNSSDIAVEDLTILVDGEEPEWRTPGGTTGVTREFTNIEDIRKEVNGTEKVIGKKYTLVLSNLQQDPNDGFDYSGTVTVSIPAGVAKDNSGNLNLTQSITMGIEISNKYAKPGELFDKDGTEPNKLHIGDFVNYDAGTWTQEEIEEIKTGEKSNLVTANGSTALPNKSFQFGGFTAGSSRNENATHNLTYGKYDYVKDKATGEGITGWRVFDIEGDIVTLISAGNPEDYYHPSGGFAYQSEYILTGNINSSWTNGATESGKYQKRDWGKYVNRDQKAESARPLTKSRLDNWYTKYTNTPNADTITESTFKKIYQEPYMKYQNMIDNYSYHLLSDTYNLEHLYCVNPLYRNIWGSKDDGIGVRLLVTLSSDTLLAKTGTKTVTGGNMDAYGGDQTYNVWNIQGENGEVIADVVDPAIQYSTSSIDRENQKVTLEIKAQDKYLDTTTEELSNAVENIKVKMIDKNGNEIVNDTTTITKTISKIKTEKQSITYRIELANFGTREGTTSITIPANLVQDLSGNRNEETEIFVGNPEDTTAFKDSIVGFVKPAWKYVRTDTTKFETEGKISFTVKAVDTYLDIPNTTLEVADLKIVKDGKMYIDGTNEADSSKIAIQEIGTDEAEPSKTFTIEISGLTETGTYTLVLAKNILVDKTGNTSPATTITFSNSEKPENTGKYGEITYYVQPDPSSKHNSFANELLDGNITTYRPSTLGELFNNGENPLFAEPMYEMSADGLTSNYKPKSFAGWAEADENGEVIQGGTTYGLYDEIPNTVTNLRAIWQDAKVVFVSAKTGNNSNSGKLPTEPVQDLETAYNKLNSAGTAENNIIVIMDKVEFNNANILNGNTTITSLYAGIDYRSQGAELKIASNMTIDGNIIFDNIKIYTDSKENSLKINNNGNLTLGRGIETPDGKYTFGTIGGDGAELGDTRIEAGTYNKIIAGITKSHNIVIGNKRDLLVGNNKKLTIDSKDIAIYARKENGTTSGTISFEMYSGKVNGDIYGGSSTSGTNIVNNMTFYGGEINGSIYGKGNNGTNTTATIHLKNLGTLPSDSPNSEVPYKIKSIQQADKLYIDNSCIELTGAQNPTNAEPYTNYTLNKIGELTISKTTLYTQRGFNKVEKFNSYSTLNQDGTGIKATMTNTDNRLYTLEGVNLIFAKQEGDLSNKNNQDIWGDINGMTRFGVYTENQAGEKVYDENLFTVGTYVEGREKTNHDITIDGFYNSNKQVIGITDNGTNYDWIIGKNVVDYTAQLIGSSTGRWSTAELELNKKYLPEATYTLDNISTNSLVNSEGIKVNLVDPLTIPVISENANNTFGLSIETTETGWYKQASANIYTNSSNGANFVGDTLFSTDNSETPAKIRFKLYNSVNITEENDLGFVNLILTGKTKNETFKIVISVNIQTIVEEQKEEFIPSFTNRGNATELRYTADSKIDLTYTLYKENVATTPYVSGDYRVISTTVQLPKGTKLTLKDYATGKIYYYQVASDTEYDLTHNVNGITRYLYKLTKFTEIGSTDAKYVDSNIYYNNGRVLEKYELSVDFINSNIDTNKFAQETYLELRNSSGNVKYDNGNTSIKYDLLTNKNAIATEKISNEGNTYKIIENLEIPIDISSSILEQSGILDTKYYDKIVGIGLQIVGQSNIRVKAPELQEFKLTNTKTNEVFKADTNGVIRMPVTEGLGSKSGNYLLSIKQDGITPGDYRVQVILYTADDGKYYGSQSEISPLEFNITVIGRLAGTLSVEADNNSRIISKATGLNLIEGSDINKAIDFTIGISNPTKETNVRVELYKRNSTYNNLSEESTYTGTSYTLVDISQYLQGNWERPEDYGLTSAEGNMEYMVSARKDYNSAVEFETLEFEKAIVQGISTGEYKLVFKNYSDDVLLQTFAKTFVVTP